MRDPADLSQHAFVTLGRVAAQAAAAADAETALSCVTAALPDLLGDREARLKPGNLKPGEREAYACGCFLITPDGRHNMLFAPINFGPGQGHMKIGVDQGHPGWVVCHREPLLLANTEDHPSFIQILETFRAGSAVFAPLTWKGALLGQIICAAQVRNTYDEADLEVLITFANLASALWIAHAGPAMLASARD